ncbi:hypothetical protein INT48_006566 [Thamnidium elegans]|uniref:Uncharacterized protein n=1 Tax=Thamnidium elegans TaxID=101142 RepID=A0A8H7VY19_9FUNG|nr:hypothetical protein INT48_006566 [Thamnidium elegans]
MNHLDSPDHPLATTPTFHVFTDEDFPESQPDTESIQPNPAQPLSNWELDVQQQLYRLNTEFPNATIIKLRQPISATTLATTAMTLLDKMSELPPAFSEPQPTSIPTGQSIHPRLHVVEQQIGLLQSEISQNASLKSSRHWREQGETSADYLKRMVQQDHFYKNLFTSEPIDGESLYSLLDTIPATDHIPTNELNTLTNPFTISDIQYTITDRSKHSSPGMDGELVQLAQLHAQLQQASTIGLCLDQQKAYDRDI